MLCSLDLLLLGATFGGLLSVFGARHASLVLLLLTIGPVNLDRFVGGFLQYDWFCAVAVAVCCYQRGRPVPAAGLMAYAVLTRIFPIFFVLAGLVPVAWSWWSDKRRPTRGLRFLVAFAAWCVLGLGVSLFNGRGVDGWREFAVNIATHREHHLFGERRVGLPFLFTHRLGSLDFDESTTDRQRTYEGQKTLAALGAAALTAGFLLSVRRLRPWRAQLLGLVPVFALLVTSRYYWSYLALLPLVAGRRAPPAKGSRWLGGAQLVVFAAFYVYDASNGDPYSAYFLLNLLILAYLVCSLAAIGSTGKAASTRAEDAPPIQHRSAPLGDHALDDKKARE